MIEVRHLPKRTWTKPIFQTVQEARLAVSSDKLAVVYVRAKDVFVVTAHGSGTFPRAEWERA